MEKLKKQIETLTNEVEQKRLELQVLQLTEEKRTIENTIAKINRKYDTFMTFVNNTYVFESWAGPVLQKDFNSLFVSWKQHHNDCTMTVKEAWDAIRQLPQIKCIHNCPYKEIWGIRSRDITDEV